MDNPILAIPLPEWTSGTPKQQQWATDIRAQMIADVAAAWEAHQIPLPDVTPEHEATLAAQDRAIVDALPGACTKMLASSTDPRWWITVKRGCVTAVFSRVSKATGARLGGIERRAKQKIDRHTEG